MACKIFGVFLINRLRNRMLSNRDWTHPVPLIMENISPRGNVLTRKTLKVHPLEASLPVTYNILTTIQRSTIVAGVMSIGSVH
jgi:hypothetical protein